MYFDLLSLVYGIGYILFVESCNLSCAPCWTVHPFRARHLDLVTVGSSTPMSVTSSLHIAVGRRKLSQKEAKRSYSARKNLKKYILCQDLDTHTPVWWDWQRSSGCPAQRFALSSPDLLTFVHFLLSNIHSGGYEEGRWGDWVWKRKALLIIICSCLIFFSKEMKTAHYEGHF